jgi:hypothetical protein
VRRASYDREHHDVTLRYLADHVARVMSNPEIARLAAERPSA